MRAGRSSTLSKVFRPRVDRILFAATKADHLHHASHDRLENVLRALTAKAQARAKGVGAEIDVIALAAVRATREALIRHDGEQLQAIVGVPEMGERIGDQVFDGAAEAAVFPGQLPEDPARLFEGDALALPEADNDLSASCVSARRSSPRARPRRRSGWTARCNFCWETDWHELPCRPRMSDQRPRPRAFRLDQSGLAEEPRVAEAPRPEVLNETAPIPAFAREPDEGEREIEAAQAAGVAKPWRPSLATLVWTGLGGLVSLGVGLWVDGIVEGLWVKASGLGWLGPRASRPFFSSAFWVWRRESSRR